MTRKPPGYDRLEAIWRERKEESMLNPETKPWWTSKTIWSGIGTIGGAVATAGYAYFVQHDTTQALTELAGLMALGSTAIYGRVKATQAIGS